MHSEITSVHYSILGHVEVVEFLGYSGADMNIKTNLGSTALHVSSLKGIITIICNLIIIRSTIHAPEIKAFLSFGFRSRGSCENSTEKRR